MLCSLLAFHVPDKKNKFFFFNLSFFLNCLINFFPSVIHAIKCTLSSLNVHSILFFLCVYAEHVAWEGSAKNNLFCYVAMFHYAWFYSKLLFVILVAIMADFLWNWFVFTIMWNLCWSMLFISDMEIFLSIFMRWIYVMLIMDGRDEFFRQICRLLWIFDDFYLSVSVGVCGIFCVFFIVEFVLEAFCFCNMT